ncbi:MAG: PilZ domain-containing protein [Candidatus Omnitrophota bacterium]
MENRRQYIRITTVLPVEFFVIDEQGKRTTPWFQGFTQDISKGGICLVVNDLWWGFWDKVNCKNTQLHLNIHVPFRKKPLATKAKVAWTSQEKLKDFNQYIVGLEFIPSHKRERSVLFRYAILKKSLPLVIATVIIVLSLSAFSFGLKTFALIRANRELVNEYVTLVAKSSQYTTLLAHQEKSGLFFKQETASLGEIIKVIEENIARLHEQMSRPASKNQDEQASIKEQIFQRENELAALRRERTFLEAKEKEQQATTRILKKEIGDLEKTRISVSEKILEGVYSWIKNRQDIKSGLVLSYEGDNNLHKISFTYDQALAAIAFLIGHDTKNAEAVLDFYVRKIANKEPIYNAYYTAGDVAEYVVHSGPNAWIGLASLQYTKQTKSKKYIFLAEAVADFLTKMMDKEGGIKGGPNESWYATEHNLDAFAFFTLFYELTGEEKYRSLAQKVQSWIVRYSYTSQELPVMRGKGDSTIATDTYTWSITAFGPQALAALQMNPERIVEFAIENCEVQTIFPRQETDVTVRGFDFAKSRHVARGGVISCEWTAQMILAFEIMADYYKDTNRDKYHAYAKLALFYFGELQKMLITSPSKIGREEPCLPYASAASVDTGHGWRTPSGSRTGSLAATAYFLIAYQGYNPLKGEFISTSLKKLYEKGFNQAAADTY